MEGKTFLALKRTLVVASLLLVAMESTDAQIVYKTFYGHKYHRAHCQYLWDSSFSLTLREADAQGLSPCSVCDPPVLNRYTYSSLWVWLLLLRPPGTVVYRDNTPIFEKSDDFFRIGFGGSTYQSGGVFSKPPRLSEIFISFSAGIALDPIWRILVQGGFGDFASKEVIFEEVAEIAGTDVLYDGNNYFWELEFGVMMLKFVAFTYGVVKYEFDTGLAAHLDDSNLFNYFAKAGLTFKFGAVSLDPSIQLIGREPGRLEYVKTAVALYLYIE
ncbi:MAG: hypothetical protein CL946_00015 [Ectothiorhodospiraceae bacterium]|nr:hypothetical protein [Ectothiorhodospiraceae bacterium]